MVVLCELLDALSQCRDNTLCVCMCNAVLQYYYYSAYTLCACVVRQVWPRFGSGFFFQFCGEPNSSVLLLTYKKNVVPKALSYKLQ